MRMQSIARLTEWLSLACLAGSLVGCNDVLERGLIARHARDPPEADGA